MHLGHGRRLFLIALSRFVMGGLMMLGMLLSTVSASTTLDQQWLTTTLATAEQKSIQNPSFAIDYLSTVLAENEQSLTPLQRSQLQLNLAENYLLNGQMTEADALRAQIAEHKAVLDEVSVIKYLLMASEIKTFIGEQEQALALLQQAQNKMAKVDDTDIKGEVYTALANFYVISHDEVRAIDYFYKAYELVNKKGNQLKIAYIETNMAKSYEALFDYDKAIQLQEQALAYFLKHDLSFDIMVSYYYLAKIYLKTSRNQEAINNANNILSINQQIGTTASFNYYAYILLAEGYFQLNNIEQAQHYLTLSNQLLPDIEDVNSLIKHYLIQAKVEHAQHKIAAVELSLNKVKELLLNMPKKNSVTYLLQLKALQAKIAIAQGDFQQATVHQQAYIDLNAQYYNQVRELTRSRHKVQFELKKVELEKKLLEKDKELNDFALLEIKQEQALHRTAMLSVLLFVLVLLIFTWRQYRLRRKFTTLANTDYLTNVANRRKVMDFAEQQWLELKPGCNRFALISFDLDHFKKVNDNYGHPAGDLVLKTIVRVAQQAIREHDFLGRIGGEEFLVVLVDTDQVEATEIAYRIKSAIEKAQIKSEEHIIKVTASLGVTQKSTQTNTFKDLLKQADKALYTAKENGRNRVEIYE